MQAIAAYFLSMLAIMGLGLSIICGGVLSIALYEGASWMWSRLGSGFLQRSKVIASLF